MFAHTTSYFFSGTAERRSLTAHSTHGVEFSTVFSFATLIDCGSISHAKASAAPSFAAVIARIPLPQPTSSTLSPPCMYFSSIAAQSLVVSCVPVPNAIPGSMSTVTSPGAASYFSHTGTMTTLFPVLIGL